MLSHRLDGAALERDHGGPLRALVPSLYFWKSAKWVTGVHFTEVEQSMSLAGLAHLDADARAKAILRALEVEGRLDERYDEGEVAGARRRWVPRRRRALRSPRWSAHRACQQQRGQRVQREDGGLAPRAAGRGTFPRDLTQTRGGRPARAWDGARARRASVVRGSAMHASVGGARRVGQALDAEAHARDGLAARGIARQLVPPAETRVEVVVVPAVAGDDGAWYAVSGGNGNLLHDADLAVVVQAQQGAAREVCAACA
ncbi:MAG: molybdopterin-dependent oxidoreductase [Sandaracinaceae bacterium]|nr:molybdopterin-dependent oxidoreductase [Sandaracinaceae bacterium]